MSEIIPFPTPAQLGELREFAGTLDVPVGWLVRRYARWLADNGGYDPDPEANAYLFGEFLVVYTLALT